MVISDQQYLNNVFSKIYQENVGKSVNELEAWINWELEQERLMETNSDWSDWQDNDIDVIDYQADYHAMEERKRCDEMIDDQWPGMDYDSLPWDPPC